MRRICTLAALTAVALGPGAGHVRAAHIETPAARAGRVAAGAVTGLRIVPADGRADVVISVSGPVAVQDFTIQAPHRIVVDISGARLLPMERAYDQQTRGGITNIRFAQYRPDVVRIVFDVASPLAYKVSRAGNDVLLSIATTERFAAWSSRETTATLAADVPQVERPALTSAVSTGTVAAVEPPRPDSASVTRVPESIDSLVATAAAARAEAEAPKAPAVRQVQQPQQPRIRVTWQDADIRDVIAGFATQTGRTIVVGKSVTGTVTAEIKDQPWDVALKAILEAQGLAATEDSSGIIVIDSYQNILEKQASEPLTTQMVSINYVTAASLVETLKGLLSKDCAPGASQSGAAPQGGQQNCVIRGSVAADSGTNALLVTEVTSRLPGLLTYVRQLDARTPQVSLKAKVISVSRTQLEQLGISYDLGSNAAFFNTLLPRNRAGQETADDREGRVTLGGEVMAGVANPLRKYKTGSALNLLFSTALGKYSLTAFLDALREQQISDIQAEPNITTLDNRRARLVVGQETPVRVIDAGSISQIGTPVRANVQFKETGIILTVTPHITNNRQVRMAIEAEQSELRIIGGDLGFVIDKRNATTQLLVGNGETAVIGGLTQTQIVRNKSGIPFLSDLPLLGRLFSQTDTREEKRDLLILITPHIIDEGEAVRPPNGSR